MGFYRRVFEIVRRVSEIVRRVFEIVRQVQANDFKDPAIHLIMRVQVKTEKGQETPARTGLGSTTVLAVVTIGFGFAGRTKDEHQGF